MKNLFKVFVAMRSIAIIALVAVIGFSFAACGSDDDSGGGGGGGGGNSALIGRWYSSTYLKYLEDGTADVPNYEFKSNGVLIVNPTVSYARIETTWTATANTLTMSYYTPADYTISGNVLTITDPNGSGMTGWLLGTYYKPSK